jgi:putative ABC transport system ATP-binding protein
MSGRTLLSVRELTKTYEMGDINVHALRGVDLDVKEGEFIAIMGASGSGKTTFMNLVGCLDKPTSGSYTLDGIDVHTMDDDAITRVRNHKIGYVFQSFYLLPRTTALENVELPLLYSRDVNHKDRHTMAMKALETVGLGKRARHFPNQLSGGQQQRVAIARAIVNDPAFLLADEPTGNLDTRTSVEVMEFFQMLHSQGKTVILVTHEFDISHYARRIITFRDGRIISDVDNPEPRDAKEDLKKLPRLDDYEEGQ